MTRDEYNQVCVEKLKQLRLEERVAVVGSGLSYRLTKRVDDLAKTLEGPCRVNKGVEEPNWDFFDRAHDANSKEYYRVVKESFSQTLPLDARLYWHIAKIRFKSFVTLNFDDQMPSAFHKTRLNRADVLFKVYPGHGCIYLPSDLTGEKQHLVAVHGYKNDNIPDWHEKLILRGKDYDLHYVGDDNSRPPFLYLWWYWLLTTVPCVFIGTSLREPGLATVIVQILKSGNQKIKDLHIHLKETDSQPPNYTESEERSLGVIQQVLYDKFDEDHAGLGRVLSSFSGEPEGSPVPLDDAEVFTIKDNLTFLKSYGGQSQQG